MIQDLIKQYQQLEKDLNEYREFCTETNRDLYNDATYNWMIGRFSILNEVIGQLNGNSSHEVSN